MIDKSTMNQSCRRQKYFHCMTQVMVFRVACLISRITALKEPYDVFEYTRDFPYRKRRVDAVQNDFDLMKYTFRIVHINEADQFLCAVFHYSNIFPAIHRPNIVAG